MVPEIGKLVVGMSESGQGIAVPCWHSRCVKGRLESRWSCQVDLNLCDPEAQNRGQRDVCLERPAGVLFYGTE